ncbi:MULTISPECIES: AMP-binding protein [unclassified Oleiphilus]|nr:MULTISPECIES: AMP-binding protein [unclassified Oleiphilus]KZY64332.1 AMP-binding acetyl-CoA synthetase [Oleiphilus sp. HI0066]KZY74441.1 AMP-binding acetyl-CoA synthetase [Oleiphilus sp. HI0067]
MGANNGFLSPLAYAYKWEKAKADDLYLTQPMGGDQVQEYTWNRAVGEARRMASYLKSLDLPPKSKIAILSKNCAHWIMSDLAIWMAGHVTVPLYPTLNAETVRYILEHSDSKLLFVGKLDDWDEMKAGVPDDLPCLSYSLSPPNDFQTWEQIVADHKPLMEETVRDADELATIVYTSGSTGKPKGVMISFGAMSMAAKGVSEALEMKDSERMLSYLPLAHVFERYAVEQASLYVGFHLFFAEALDTFVQDLKRARPTVFISVPRLWAKFQLGVFQKMTPEKLKFLQSIPIISSLVNKKVLKNLGLDHCHFAVSGSAPLSEDIINWYRGLGLELMEGYGMSENFAYSHISMPGRARVGYVGEPLLGVQQRISEKGEIEIKSPAAMMGYYKDDEKTKESYTEDGFLLTGDKGEIDELGRLKITGRIKEIFKTSKGKYVAPAPIENKLMVDQAIEVVCVAGADCAQPYAVAVLPEHLQAMHGDQAFRDKTSESLKGLIKFVNATLDQHEAIQFIVVVSDVWGIENNFLTPTMKIKRDVIESHYAPKVETWFKAKESVLWD